MQGNALRKQDFIQDSAGLSEALWPEESWEARRRRIVLAVEEACCLPGNINGPDLEEFAVQYGLHQTGCFA